MIAPSFRSRCDGLAFLTQLLSAQAMIFTVDIQQDNVSEFCVHASTVVAHDSDYFQVPVRKYWIYARPFLICFVPALSFTLDNYEYPPMSIHVHCAYQFTLNCLLALLSASSGDTGPL